MSDIYQICKFAGVGPENYEEAIKHDVWNKAMEEEIQMIEKNNTWELVAIPKEREVVSLKWIYKIKHNQEEDIQKHKERLVSRGLCKNQLLIFMKLSLQLLILIQLDL